MHAASGWASSRPNDFADQVRARLAAHPPITVAEWEARPAAVLVPLYFDSGEWRMLFTQRTDHVEEHKGQVSFPGGGVDEGDADRVATALRETEEEIGLSRRDVTVLGTLDELITVTQYRVTPVVGAFPWPYDFRINPRECAGVFGVSLRWLADPANLETRYRPPPIAGPPVAVYYFREYQGHVIWGVTARIVLDFLRRMQA